MNIELHGRNEKFPDITFEFLDNIEKEEVKEEVLDILRQYPDNFFPDYFNDAIDSFDSSKVVIANQGGPIGCLFFKPETCECDFLAISRDFKGDKTEVAKKLFQVVFDSVPKGTVVYWYVNAEDAMFEGRPVGRYFAPARKLYLDMGAKFTKVSDKFGEGNHAYRIEITT